MNPQNGESWTGPAALGFADRGTSSVQSCPWACSQVLQPRTAAATSQGALPAKPASHPVQLPPCGDRQALVAGGGRCEEPLLVVCVKLELPTQASEQAGLWADPLGHTLASWLRSSGWSLPPGIPALRGAPFL